MRPILFITVDELKRRLTNKAFCAWPWMLVVIKLGNPMGYYIMMRLRIAAGLGLVLFMATMIGGQVRVSHAQDDERVTLASLAGEFAGRGSGFVTLCFSPGPALPLISCSSVSPVPTPVPFNQTGIFHRTGDAAGNFCGVITVTTAPVFGTKFPAGVSTNIQVGTTTFDPTTGSGTQSFSRYHGGTCSGAVFDSTGATKVGTTTSSFVVSDSGDRIESIITSFSTVTSAVSVAGSAQGNVFSPTAIRQRLGGD